MGLEIKKNDDGLYQLRSSVNGECYHPDSQWVTADQAKAILINMAFDDFIIKAIRIDMDWPRGQIVNDRLVPFSREPDEACYLDWYRDNWQDQDAVDEKFDELYDRLGLDFTITK